MEYNLYIQNFGCLTCFQYGINWNYRGIGVRRAPSDCGTGLWSMRNENDDGWYYLNGTAIYFMWCAVMVKKLDASRA